SGESLVGNRPLDVPKTVANLWLSYRHESWSYGLGARYVGERFVDDANTRRLPSYTVYDAAVSYKVNRHLKIGGFVRNLTDRLYATASYGPDQLLLAPPRQLTVVAEYAF